MYAAEPLLCYAAGYNPSLAAGINLSVAAGINL